METAWLFVMMIPTICSLENLNEDVFLKSKADIFHERTIGKKIVIERAETSNEALLLSLSEKAKVDFDYMFGLIGLDKEKIRRVKCTLLFGRKENK